MSRLWRWEDCPADVWEAGRIDRANNPPRFRARRNLLTCRPNPWSVQVEYDAAGFLAKNLDVLHVELPALLGASTDPLLASIFNTDQAATDENAAPANQAARGRGEASKARTRGHGTLRTRGLAGGFTRQLDALMATLAATTPHYVRCIKPNDQMAAAQMHQPLVLSQLRCAGTSQLLQLMGRGYPTRCEFEALACRYRQLLPSLSAGLSGREFVQALLSALDLQPASLARPGGRQKFSWHIPFVYCMLNTRPVRPLALTRRTFKSFRCRSD